MDWTEQFFATFFLCLAIFGLLWAVNKEPNHQVQRETVMINGRGEYVDEWNCLKSHTTSDVSSFMMVGSVMVPMYSDTTVCDAWERKSAGLQSNP